MTVTKIACALLVGTVLGATSSGCGAGPDGATINVSNTNTQTQDNAQNVDSQNGEAECEFSCLPVSTNGLNGYAVTQTCAGAIQSGPDFFANAPTNCVFPEGEVAAEVTEG